MYFQYVRGKSLYLEKKISFKWRQHPFYFYCRAHTFWAWHHLNRGGLTGLFSHVVGMRIPLCDCLHSQMGGATTQPRSSLSKVFFIINRKVILSACLRMFMETYDFDIWNSFLRMHANQTTE